jgi:peptide/nickel transport system substrate-binding protein
MIREALRIHRDEVGHLPRHDQMLARGLKSTVTVSQTADNVLKLQRVRIE